MAADKSRPHSTTDSKKEMEMGGAYPQKTNKWHYKASTSMEPSRKKKSWQTKDNMEKIMWWGTKACWSYMGDSDNCPEPGALEICCGGPLFHEERQDISQVSQVILKFLTIPQSSINKGVVSNMKGTTSDYHRMLHHLWNLSTF